MKKLLNTLIALLFVINISAQTEYCSPEVSEIAKSQLDANAVVLKEFHVHLEKSKRKEPPKSHKYTMILSQKTIYQFTIANSDEYTGKAIFKLYSDDKLLGSTYNEKTGKNYKTFTFKCQKTGQYHMFIQSIDKKESCAVAVLAYIKEME